jgi:hypothetical protein
MRARLVMNTTFTVGLAVATPAPALAQVTSDPSGPARRQLAGIVQNVTLASRAQYGSRDTAGRTLDTIKVIERGAGGYVSAFHSPNGSGSFSVRLRPRRTS